MIGDNPAAELWDHITILLGDSNLNPNTLQASDLRVRLTLKSAIRQWIIAKGVSERTAAGMGDVGLAKCVSIGNVYINGIIRREAEEQDGRRKVRGGDRFGRNDVLDLDSPPKVFKPDETPKLGDLLGTPKVENEIEKPKPQFDLDDLAKAADAVIAPRIHAATAALTGSVAEAVKTYTRTEIERIGLGNNLSKEIEDLVERSTIAAVEKLMPRAIDLRMPHGENRILKAEPRHRKFDVILKWLSTGQHVYAVGPKGSGKTHMGVQLAEALDLKFYPIAQALTKYDLSGYTSPTGEYIKTLMRDVIEHGGLALIDEGDMWAAAALGFLNSALANNFIAFPDKVIEVHKDFRCLLAANTFGTGADRQYVGRNPLDAASLDRFAFEVIDYDPDMERQIFGPSAWLDYVHRVRSACSQLNLPHLIPSMRAISKGLKGYSVDMDADSIAASSIWMGAAQDTISKIKNIAGEPPRVKEKQNVESPINNDYYTMRDFRDFVVKDQMIDAIKVLRVQFPNLGLKDAKDLTENYRDGLKTIGDVCIIAAEKERAVA
jgi:cobaltochelatase CobS